MSEFWGYPYADWLAVFVIAGCSALCLWCARRYVKNY
jgi:hypothetical protein